MSLVTAAVATPAAAAPASTSAAPANSEVKLFPASDSKTDQQVEKLPINLARAYLGTTATVKFDGDKKELNTELRISGLLRDDDSYRYEVRTGVTTFVVALPQNTATNRFCLVSEECEGTVRFYSSSTQLDMASPKWQPLTDKIPVKGSFPLSANWAWADLRYLKVEFDLQKAGRLGPFGLFGAPTVKDVRVVTAPGRPENMLPTSTTLSGQQELPAPITEPINVASVSAKGRVSHVSSGISPQQDAATMIDNDVATAYNFDSNDPNPSLIVGLSQQRPISRITAYYQADPGVWEVYPLNSLPGDKEDAQPASTVTKTRMRGTPLLVSSPAGIASFATSLLLGQGAITNPQILNLPSDFFQKNHTGIKLDQKSGDPYGVAQFTEQKARYVLFRWVPANPGPATQPMRVFQITIFVDPHKEWLDALPTVDFASLGAEGIDGTVNLNLPPLPTDPPRQPDVSP